MKKILLLVLVVFIMTETFSQWQKIDLPKWITVNKLYSSNDKLFAGTSNGVYQLVSGKWNKLSSNVNFSVTGILDYNNYLYAGTASNGIYRSSNGGNSWVQINNSLTSMAIQDIKLYKNYIVIGTSNGLFMSDNNGVQWTDKSGNITDKNIKAILTFNDSLLVGTKNGVYMSSDTAKTWKPKNIGLSSKNVSSITSVNSKLFISIGNGGVFMSVDSAKSWTAKNTNLTNLNVNTLFFQNDSLFAGSTDSLYLATNLSNIIWKSLKQPSGGILTIGEHNKSLFIGNELGVFRQSNLFETFNEGFPELTFSKLYSLDSFIFSSTNKGIWSYNCIRGTWN